MPQVQGGAVMSTETRIKSNALLCLSQVIAYAIICINIRAVAHADYTVAVISDLVFAFLNFYAISKIAKGENSFDSAIAYATGSAIGSVIGIKISETL